MPKIQVSVSEIVSKMNVIFVTVGKALESIFIRRSISNLLTIFFYRRIVLFIGLCGAAPVDNSPRVRDNSPDSTESPAELPGLEEFFKYTWFIFHTEGE